MSNSIPSNLLQTLRPKRLLLNAHSKMRNKYRRIPLWSFVSDVTGHGSGYSSQICHECGWVPDQDGSKPLVWDDTNPSEPSIPSLAAENAALREQVAKLREALKLFAALRVEDCEKCDGTGKDIRGNESACTACDGIGRLVMGFPNPQDVDAAKAALSASEPTSPCPFVPNQALIDAAREAQELNNGGAK